MSRPAFVTLRLTRPRMGARDRAEAALIRLVQHRLEGLAVDGIYGCRTSARVQIWQHQQGSPNTSGAIAPDELLVMLGYRQRPPGWITRAASRLERGRWTSPPDPVLSRCADPAPPRPSLRIIPRAAIGLRAPKSAPRYAPHPRGVGFVVHYQGGGHGALGLEASLVQLRGFQAYHMAPGGLGVADGASDIAYNWAIPRGAPRGTVITLRGRNVRGAHSGHATANALPGVLVMFGTADPGPTADQLATLEALRAAEGWGRPSGHREWSPTSCPGPALMAWVRAHR